ncbi:MAG: YlxM family DNA-binding protein [Sporomusa sp.]
MIKKQKYGVKKKHLTPLMISGMITQVMFMESIVKQSLLYDFYGELLTEHQRSIYEDAVFNDMSLGEIAGERGISRQGVHDLIRRCDRILSGYEEKLQLLNKFLQTKAMVEEIQKLIQMFKETQDGKLIDQIEKISANIMEL